ncbi:hypothetical protein MKW98_007828 [Papaver atlanticum]|uniref:Proteasome alpha-type subunits domain-containing protein n=1 Tax=Papaver atlanticum TaxID=357466 RepID=A0AAD4RY69_9MAGN|nr:hypothetical protein MKW98_007828 [Papaver atlanticum]
MFHFLTKTNHESTDLCEYFSTEGRLFQVEYGIKAIKFGSTAIWFKTKEGVVLAVESVSLCKCCSVDKTMGIDEHIGCAMCGLIVDAPTLVEYARVRTQLMFLFSYGEPMTIESTTQDLYDLALRLGEGKEESTYYTDPYGTFWQCNAKAIGSRSDGADSVPILQNVQQEELGLLCFLVEIRMSAMAPSYVSYCMLCCHHISAS